MKLYIALLNLLCLTGFAFAQDKLPPRVVRVVGTAEVKVAPDRAVIELGVQKQDPNAAAAKAALTERPVKYLLCCALMASMKRICRRPTSRLGRSHIRAKVCGSPTSLPTKL